MKSQIENSNIDDIVDKYAELLLMWNKRVNLISKKSEKQEILILIKESIFMAEYINSKIVIDAGSGNGLLGIPIALKWPIKKVFLIESIRKKANILKEIIISLKILNTEVFIGSVEEFLRSFKEKNVAIVSRGFPRIENLVKIALKKNIEEIHLITVKKKLVNIPKSISNYRQNMYNIPWRNQLIVFSLLNVSRET